MNPGRSYIAFCLGAGLMLSMSLVGSAEIVYSQSEGSGVGRSRREAVEDALSEAVGRINGVQIAARSRNELRELATVENDTATTLSTESSERSVDTDTKGVVRRYAVVREETLLEGMLRVWVRAEVAHFLSKEEDRIRLAIGAVEPGAATYQFVDGVIDGVEVCRQIRRRVVDLVVSTRKFAVLDDEFRKQRQQLLEEIEGKETRSEELARLGQSLGADYVVVGCLEECHVQEDRMDQMVVMKGRLRVSYRVVDVATGVTALATVATGELNQPLLPGVGGNRQDWISRLCDQAAARIARRIQETAAPIRVLETHPELVLNIGGESVREGDKLKLYNLGRRLTDPVTGESLGFEEIEAGFAVITRVLPKVSYARVGAQAHAVKAGAICRFDTESKTIGEKTSVIDSMDSLFR